MIRGLVVALSCAGCYSPAVEDCAFLCARDTMACPKGLTCEDGFCRTPDFQGACPGDLCGNFFTDPGEQCDDDTDDTDECAQCKNATCGDGFVWVGNNEECDDGNFDNQDGCAGCKWAYCGDGYTRLGVESCDSANPDCTANCIACASDTAARAYAAMDGHCYRQSQATAATWIGGYNACAGIGGHLATLVDEAQASMIDTQLNITVETWVGLTQTADIGMLAWVTGEPFAAAEWTTFSDEQLERCFVLNGTGLGDYGCSVLKAFLCEQDGWIVDDAPPIDDNHAYEVVYQQATWSEANDACNGILGNGRSHLATIDSMRVDLLLRQHVFLDAWVGGPPDCQLRLVTGQLRPETCEARHPFICEVD